MPRPEKKEYPRADIEHLLIPADELRWQCDFDVDLFANLVPLEDWVLIGQPRAELALELGLGKPGHIFVAAAGSISSALVNAIAHIASGMPPPALQDIVCVQNFREPTRPVFIKLPKGKGVAFRESMEQLTTTLQEEIPELLDGRKLRAQEDGIRNPILAVIQNKMAELTGETEAATIPTVKFGNLRLAFFEDPNSMQLHIYVMRQAEETWAPISAEDHAYLSAEERQEIHEKMEEIIPKGDEFICERNGLNDAIDQKIEELRAGAVDALFRERTVDILREYGEAVFDFIEGLREYAVSHREIFMQGNDGHNPPKSGPSPIDPFPPFKVNVALDNSAEVGMPIIVERNPTYSRLFGRVGQRGVGNVSYSDHTMVEIGALARASDGILILPLAEVLKNNGWDRLMAVLSSKKLDIGEVQDALGIYAGMVKPKPLGITAKVILVGDMSLYDALTQSKVYEDAIADNIRIVVEFDAVASLTGEIVSQYARLIRAICEKEGLPRVTRDAFLKILEYASRLVEEDDLLSLDIREVKTILHEAAYFAKKKNGPLCASIEEEDVQVAFEKKRYISNLLQAKVYRQIRKGTLIVDLAGRKVGELNALVVYNQENRLSFGSILKVTGNTFVGKEGAINIEEKVGGADRSQRKGFETLVGYLREKYGKNSEISFAGTVCFEQSYGGIAGDSGTLAELYVILSSLSGLSLRQDIAITGSMNLKGVVQPIGGAMHKIEGFFDVCKMVGFTGEQGVIIPNRNRRNLIFRKDILDAIRDGKFHIYGIDTVEQGIEILTGVRAGELIRVGRRGKIKGQPQFPQNTINYLVHAALKTLSQSARQAPVATGNP